MQIVGVDSSSKSPGFFKFHLDENLNITKKEYLGFYCYSVPKRNKNFVIPKFENIISYNEDLDFYNRVFLFKQYIKDFLKDVSYVSFEDYAYGANGNLTELAEICSMIKILALENGAKLRLISPIQNKQFAGNYKAKKPDMFDFYMKEDDKIDLSHLPQIKVRAKGKNIGERDENGIAPLSDIVDAYYLCKLLHFELKAKRDETFLDSISSFEKHVLVHTTPTNKIPLYKREFIKVTI